MESMLSISSTHKGCTVTVSVQFSADSFGLSLQAANRPYEDEYLERFRDHVAKGMPFLLRKADLLLAEADLATTISLSSAKNTSGDEIE